MKLVGVLIICYVWLVNRSSLLSLPACLLCHAQPFPFTTTQHWTSSGQVTPVASCCSSRGWGWAFAWRLPPDSPRPLAAQPAAPLPTQTCHLGRRLVKPGPGWLRGRGWASSSPDHPPCLHRDFHPSPFSPCPAFLPPQVDDLTPWEEPIPPNNKLGFFDGSTTLTCLSDIGWTSRSTLNAPPPSFACAWGTVPCRLKCPPFLLLIASRGCLAPFPRGFAGRLGNASTYMTTTKRKKEKRRHDRGREINANVCTF